MREPAFEGELRGLFPALTDVQWDQLHRYYELLTEWNERINLTAIVEAQDVYVKHFADSLLVQTLPAWRAMPDGSRIADVGTGAGFPGLVLAIAEPGRSFVLVDALNKRVRFLQEVVDELGLKNVACVHARAEEAGRRMGLRDACDAVVSRAVARLNVLLEYTLPLARRGGMVIAYKGPAAIEEIEDGRGAAKRLGGGDVQSFERTLPFGAGTRLFLVIDKLRETPKGYPRRPGAPAKQPLV
ncbi:MAG: 16S rRNA (guanine(527)-N(7))-methyltransferase RsmG [Alicyclobacillus sp.]|nr:16S rRNA (guanine(527)-N(7))-methyltransferase RsmG [Alicyclobacillus sp.]